MSFDRPQATVIWNEGLRRFQDAATRRIVGFREAAERVRRIEVGPDQWRLQDATGRFVGNPQFTTASEYSWTSEKKRYVRFTKETEKHVIGADQPLSESKVTMWEFFSEGERVGDAFSSVAYGEKYTLDHYLAEPDQKAGYLQSVATDLALDIDAIDEVKTRYFEYRYYNPI